MGKSKYTEFKVHKEVENQLQQSGVYFLKSVIANGTSADFYISTPTSGSVIFEVKNWDPTPDNINRAKIISNSIRTSANVNQAYVVLPEKGFEDQKKFGVISVNQVNNVIDEFLSNPKTQISDVLIKNPINHKKAFVAMPFEPKFEDTYFSAIEPACNEVDVKPIRIDQIEYSGDIMDKIREQISLSDLLIADISMSKPNVTYEVGYSDAKGHPKIQLCMESNKKMPFDIDHDKTIFYEDGRTHLLKPKIISHLKTLLQIL
jgi:nucleoside 2-deoxyribosyltransferase